MPRTPILTSDFQKLSQSSFANNVPCPWTGFHGLLGPSAFRGLVEEFPALEHFERHDRIPRCHDQRPHDRYYLALSESVYGPRKGGAPGVIQPHQLSPTWQAFIVGLQGGGYLDFARELLGHSGAMHLRFAWHVAGNGADVSPHVDSERKIGTHIFYFNTSDDWSADWGGRTAFLSGKLNEKLNPEFSDFEKTYTAEMLDNRSMLFKNTPDAWHGAEPISCPPGRHRRIFNVIFEHPVHQPVFPRLSKMAGKWIQSVFSTARD